MKQEIDKKIIKSTDKLFSPAILITGIFDGEEYILENRKCGKWMKKSEYIKTNNLN